MWLIVILAIWAMLAPGGILEVLFLCLVFSPVLLAVYFIGEVFIHIFRSGRR